MFRESQQQFESPVAKFKRALEVWKQGLIVIPEHYEPLYLGVTEVDDKAEIAEIAMTTFLNNSDKKVLLVLGSSGSGKTCLGQKFACDLLKPESNYLPLWIPLAKQKHIDDKFIDRFLTEELKLDRDTHAELKLHSSWVFILDGVDELNIEYQEKNLYRIAELHRWKTKVVTVCRSEVVSSDEQKTRLFAPYIAQGEQDKQGLETLYVQSLTSQQQEHYLHSSFKLEDASCLLDAWKHILGLQELGKTPFVLQLIAKHLPQILAKYKDKEGLSQLMLTRLDLYRAFKEDWFKRQREKLLSQDRINDSWEIEKDFEEYTQRLARELHKMKLTSFKIPYTAREEMVEERRIVQGKKSGGSSLLSFSEGHTVPSMRSSPEEPLEALLAERGQWHCKDNSIKPLELVRQGCPLKALGGGEWIFLHKSLLEYFASERLFQSMANQVGIALGRDLNSELLVNDISFRQFAADEVKKNKEFKEALWQMVKESRHEVRVQIAAANAISILNYAGESFAHQDLRRVRIAKANLSGAILDSVDLSDADLREVVLEGAWLNNANLQRACIDDIALHQLPYLQLKGNACFCCFPVDGQLLVVVDSYDIKFYDKNRQLKYTFSHMHNDSPIIAALSADGKMLASSGSFKGIIKLWNVESRTLKHTFDEQYHCSSIAFSADGKILASGDWYNTIRLWDVDNGTLVHTFTHSDEIEESVDHYFIDYYSINSLVFSADGKMLASGGHDKIVKVWDVESGTLKHAFPGHSDRIQSVAFSADGKMLASGSSDKTVKLWDIESDVLKHTFIGHSDRIQSVAFSADGKMLASGSHDKIVKVWDVESGTLKHAFVGHSDRVRSVAFSADGKLLASAGNEDKTVRFWNLERRSFKYTLAGHSDLVQSIAFSADGKILVSGSDDNTIKLWDIASRALKYSFDSDLVRSVAISVDGKILASGGHDKTVKLRDVESHTLKCSFGSDSVSSVALSAEGKMLATVRDQVAFAVELWDAESCTLLHTFSVDTFEGHSGSISNVTFSADGKVLALACIDNTVRLWDVENSTYKHPFQGGCDIDVSGLALSTDGKMLGLSRSWDKTVRLWDIEKKTLVQTLKYLDEVHAIAFSSDGYYLAIAAGKAIFVCERHSTNHPASPFTLLHRFSQDVHLSAQALNLTQATGITEYSDAYRLLIQLGAEGLPNVKKSSEEILRQREEAEYCEKPTEPLLKVQDGSHLLSPGGTCIAAIVSNKTSQKFGHIFLLLEFMESIGDTRYPAYHKFKRIDLFLDERLEYSNYLGLAWKGQSVIVIADKGIEDIKILLEDCQYRAYPLDTERAKKLINNIEQEQKAPPKYSLIGGTSKIGSEHNCLTWIEAKLMAVGCNVQHRWVSIVTHPNLRGLQDHRRPQEGEPITKRPRIGW